MTENQETIEASMPNLEQIASNMLGILDARSKDIVIRRFGLKKPKLETLESIGREYGITRERVRQIESNAKRALSVLDDNYEEAQILLANLFVSRGGILAHGHVVSILRSQLNQDVSENLVRFLLETIPEFTYVTSRKEFGPHWEYNDKIHPQADEIVRIAEQVLGDKNHPISFEELSRDIHSGLGAESSLPAEVIEAVLIASKNIRSTAFGDWGMITWSETSPRGVGDKAYTVLRRHNKPAHFREIASLINAAAFDQKIANPQTVHNELIKDGRFVLVGRGLYGLKEWGYISGTVADVLESILEKAEQPLTREELIDRVLKQRMVKKNTILLSLQNNKRFSRTGEDRYTLRK